MSNINLMESYTLFPDDIRSEDLARAHLISVSQGLALTVYISHLYYHF